MNPPKQSAESPNVTATQSANYRNSYANNIQVHTSVWDFFLVFGAARQESPDQVTIENFQGIYISPQQAKALVNLLGHNVAQYEKAFGAIALEPHLPPPTGPVH